MDSPPTQRLRPAHDRTTEVDDLTPVPVTEIAQADAPLGARYQTLGLATINCRAGVTLGRALGGRAVLDIANAAEGLVALGDLIATGGMGEVRSAVQHRLRREVAVKRARGDASEETHQAMLREAWIAGSLEHPNILPIHTLSRDGSEPLIVMKRVYGRVWTELLRDQRLAPGDARWVEPIGVLVEVCRAVHFAHSRGVLHLDLKPDNVMVGEHGEVVLLDWGVAAAFDTSLAPDFITKTDSITHVCGTLGYLSPEQATAHGASFGPTTDVYLLGAILHEIITGHPPHLSPHTSLVASLVSSHRAEPPVFDASVPEELRAIARRAL
ncbi:MAG: serine/threonine protein kinase, partial [Deltaproteobacteria bacterium]|nr:serine/threonine protein kinase [Deltaproteobacteria bacterium]